MGEDLLSRAGGWVLLGVEVCVGRVSLSLSAGSHQCVRTAVCTAVVLVRG
jgi:hypothetical protein